MVSLFGFGAEPAWSFDKTGKVAIVTGASSGLGKITALELARKGAHVILANRSEEKSLPIVAEIKEKTGNQNVEFLSLDLASLAACKAFVKAFKAKNLPLHLLVNNAGIMALPQWTPSKDGIELQFASNHMGHFLITRELLPNLEKNQPSRVVNLSSMGHNYTYKDGIAFDHINDPNYYFSWQAYGQSKLANILFTRELQRYVEERGHTRLYVNAVHPGVVTTNLFAGSHYVPGFVNSLLSSISTPPEKGALTQLYAATSEDIETNSYKGQYFVPVAQLSKPSTFGLDDALAKKLWEYSEKVLGEKGFAVEV
ncbi:hypothetical protein HDV00_005269 [Rhizophlyctis rosea]|nr:hypothetical protein HDV00_005269 [Rhizophlyctis rosea]